VSGGSGSESNSSSNKASSPDDDQVIGAFTIAASCVCFAWCVLCVHVCPNLAPQTVQNTSFLVANATIFVTRDVIWSFLCAYNCHCVSLRHKMHIDFSMLSKLHKRLHFFYISTSALLICICEP
jgi:hypothetical protein